MGAWEHQGPDIWLSHRRTTHGGRYLYGYAVRDATRPAGQDWEAIIADEVGGHDTVLGRGLTLDAAKAAIEATAAAE